MVLYSVVFPWTLANESADSVFVHVESFSDTTKRLMRDGSTSPTRSHAVSRTVHPDRNPIEVFHYLR